MRRWGLAFVPSACVVFVLALVSGGAGCDATLNLSLAGDAAAAPTCATACSRIIDTCQLTTAANRASCLSQCAVQGTAAELQCVVDTACFAIANVCGGGTVFDASAGDSSDPFDAAAPEEYQIQVCDHGGCDPADNQGCFTAQENAACYAQCAAGPPTKRDAYEACSNGAGGDCAKQAECLAVFVGD